MIDKLEVELFKKQNTFAKSHLNFGLKDLLKQFGKSNNQIAREVKDFCGATWFIDCGKGITEQSEFYAYYSDYDWVVFCSLFGRMIDLPKGFPMYCIDLKQELDRKANEFKREDFFTAFDFKNEGIPELTLIEKVEHLKMHVNYPSQKNEHNALDDARWNFELFQFLQCVS